MSTEPIIDLSALSPAPWEAEPFDPDFSGGALYSTTGRFAGFLGNNNFTACQFVALARNAFEVMQNRSWTVRHVFGELWGVVDATTLQWPLELNGALEDSLPATADPFTALVAADAWLKEKERQRAD